MNSNTILKSISIICFTVAFILICLSLNPSSYDSNFEGTTLTEGKDIEINPPENFNNKTKSEIYAIRKNFVSKSIFASSNYQPSDEVFGQIEDYKPWIDIKMCRDDNTGASTTDAPAEESRFINNPSMLVGINYLYEFNKCDEQKKNTYIQFLPRKIQYYKKENVIKVYYDYLPYNFFYTAYTFDGTNARDLGYKYAYVDTQRTSINLKFKSQTNITNKPHEFLNFIHLGGSCDVEGGCNNGSPHQPELDFNYTINDKTTNPEIYIKLWKEKPENPNQEPDIVEIISIDKE